MGKECVTVGENLRQVLWGELLTIVSLVAADVGRGLQVLPLVWLGGLVGVVSMGMIVIGLAGAASVRRGYRKALFCAVAELVFGVIQSFVPNLGKGILSILIALAASTGVWYVCKCTEEVLQEVEEKESGGGLVWKLYATISILVSIAYAVFIYSPWFPLSKLPVMLIAPVLQIAVLFLYLHFLDKSQHTLRGK